MNVKIPCGGFLYDDTVFEFQPDKETKMPVLSVTANIPTSGSDLLIMKASDSDDLYKITIAEGALKVEKYISET